MKRFKMPTDLPYWMVPMVPLAGQARTIRLAGVVPLLKTSEPERKKALERYYKRRQNGS